MLIYAGPPQSLGTASQPRIRFGEEPKTSGTWRGRRVLSLHDKPAFELSFWCGTCAFLFERLEGANETCSIPDLEQRLTDGLQHIDQEVMTRFGDLLPRGDFLPLLLTIEPRLVHPCRPGDYFAEEQVAVWGLNGFWGLPENPRTPYYRTFDTRIDDGTHLFEFVVPMVPPSWNDPDRVAAHARELAGPSGMTAVAVSILDVCEPAGDITGDHAAHWALTHFLLDGHHKMQAAAETGRPLRLLSLLSVDASLAEPDQVARIPELRAVPPGTPADPVG
ncbi:hypothetical protein [Catellatospora paridis]|uniref:hypothetical protein n=1 Tax=Catellatospora paridis TaxID=1617086 RepID=UPI0018AF6120|nr:hypothetical protein [Catellatospora paridis]